MGSAGKPARAIAPSNVPLDTPAEGRAARRGPRSWPSSASSAECVYQSAARLSFRRGVARPTPERLIVAGTWQQRQNIRSPIRFSLTCPLLGHLSVVSCKGAEIHKEAIRRTSFDDRTSLAECPGL